MCSLVGRLKGKDQKGITVLIILGRSRMAGCSEVIEAATHGRIRGDRPNLDRVLKKVSSFCDRSAPRRLRGI